MDIYQKNIFIVAGEPSGDIRGAELVRELKKASPGAVFFGIGGDNMKAEGVRLIEHIRNLSMIGAIEIIKKLPQIREHFKKCERAVNETRPDAAILIDYPGFNLKLAGILKKKGIPVIYYIIPQVWAWGASRIKTIKKNTDKVIVLFDFEKAFLAKHGIAADFAGHPLVENIPDEKTAKDKDAKKFTIALLPGSRKSEINNLFKVMLEAAELLAKEKKNIAFTLAESPTIAAARYDSMLAGHPSLKVSRVKNDIHRALALADMAIAASGTATLEASMMEKPFVVVYRSSPLTAFIVRLIITIKNICIVNIIAGKEVAPEVLQEKLTAENLAAKVREIMNSPARMEEMRKELLKVNASIGPKGAARRAANYIKSFLGQIRSI
jgi:lipid-A-disaccharide synthase